jgi:AcrR family transcriptional regulator
MSLSFYTMSTVKSRREQYSDATRAALIDAATRRFAADGFAKTALEDVAADINATRGAVYHHFSNKQALFRAVHDKLESTAVANVTALAAKASNPWEGALWALDAFLDQCLDPTYSRIVWREAPAALGWPEWHLAEGTYAYGIIEQLITALIATGEIEPVPLGTATRIMFSMLGSAGTTLAEAAPGDQRRLRDEYSHLISQMIKGWRIPSGQAAHDGVGEQTPA